ncbi:MAG: hypothetical protein JW965_02150 [Bacteroidales bacterium]|nr:hypothetical protein [Bacteroidales bacterium]
MSNMKTRLLLYASIIIHVFLFAGCTEYYEEVTDCNLSGTLTTCGPDQDYSGCTFIMYIDVDTDPDNGNHVKALSDIFTGGEFHYSYDISDVEPGIYYVYIMMDIAKGFLNVGFYDGGLKPGSPPDAPNVEIKCRTVLNWEIYH